MSTTKPVSPTAVTLPAPAVAQTPVKPEFTKPVTEKRRVVKKQIVRKSAPAKPVPARPEPEKSVTAKAPRTRAKVITPVAKKPPSKELTGTKLDKAVKTSKAVKLEKAKKPKLVRDSFTIPKAEYEVLDALKYRATRLTRSVKKSELLRAGIKVLATLSDAAFLTALEQVPAIKTGRPAAEK